MRILWQRPFSAENFIRWYINGDTLIVPMIKMLRDSGRSTFLVTNSLWDYTNAVMNFLCGPQTLDSGSTSNFEWLRYFEVVITGSAKPSFFHDENRANAFEVEPESGMLLNTDNGTPMPQVGGASMLPLKSLNKSCRVFQGANVGHLHKLLGIGSSSQVLYVGDHIYGDILRSKKVLGCSIHEEGCGFSNPKLSKSSLKATMPPSQCHVACGSRNGRSICSDDASTYSLF